VAFSGVLVISPPKCLSKENKFEGESHWGRSDVGGSSGSQYIQQLLKTVQPEGEVAGCLFRLWRRFRQFSHPLTDGNIIKVRII